MELITLKVPISFIFFFFFSSVDGEVTLWSAYAVLVSYYWWTWFLIGHAGHDGNGSAVHAEGQSLVVRMLLFWKTFKTFLPNGRWWRVIERQNQRPYNITFAGAMSRLWVLVSPDKLIIGFAFTALVIAAVRFSPHVAEKYGLLLAYSRGRLEFDSCWCNITDVKMGLWRCSSTVYLFKPQLSEITIPHFVAAMIFAAQKGMTSEFYNNAKLLVSMACMYGLFRLVSSKGTQKHSAECYSGLDFPTSFRSMLAVNFLYGTSEKT
jgi:hypothetical protein